VSSCFACVYVGLDIVSVSNCTVSRGRVCGLFIRCSIACLIYERERTRAAHVGEHGMGLPKRVVRYRGVCVAVGFLFQLLVLLIYAFLPRVFCMCRWVRVPLPFPLFTITTDKIVNEFFSLL